MSVNFGFEVVEFNVMYVDVMGVTKVRKGI